MATIIVQLMISKDIYESFYTFVVWIKVFFVGSISRFEKLMLLLPCVVQWMQSVFMAGVCNLVIISQGNILDVFMNAAALIVIMEIDDHVGEYCMQQFSSQTVMLKVRNNIRVSSYANLFSTLVLISFSIVACIF